MQSVEYRKWRQIRPGSKKWFPSSQRYSEMKNKYFPLYYFQAMSQHQTFRWSAISRQQQPLSEPKKKKKNTSEQHLSEKLCQQRDKKESTFFRHNFTTNNTSDFQDRFFFFFVLSAESIYECFLINPPAKHPSRWFAVFLTLHIFFLHRTSVVGEHLWICFRSMVMMWTHYRKGHTHT